MKRLRLSTFIKASLALALLISSLPWPSAALALTEDTQYIVKYSRDCPRGGGPDRGPRFDVVSARELETLLAEDALEWYEEDGYALLADSPPLPEETAPFHEDAQWNLDLINAGAAFSLGYMGQGVRVGVIDSGIAPHACLEGRLAEGRNYITDAADPDDTTDYYGHGTKVAALIAGADDNGFIGAAPMAEVVPLKCTDGKSVKISAICRAVYGGIDDYGCSVLNLSLATSTDYESLREAMEYAAEKNVTVVAAAGNISSKAVAYYPALYDTVIGVGSVDSSGSWYGGSNYFDGCVSVAAPGTGLRSANYAGGFSYYISGTSFAAPQVSAAAAVLLSVCGSLTPGQIADILTGYAADAGDEGFDRYFGWGILDVGGSVAALTGRTAEGDDCSLIPGEDGGPARAVLNNTDRALTCVCVTALYGDLGQYLGSTLYTLTVPPGESADLALPDGGYECVQYVLSQAMIPLTPALKTLK